MKKLLFLVLFLVLGLPSVSTAVTRYVQSSCTNGITTYNPGADTCTGGSATVYSTVQNGVTGMSSGDTLSVRAGTYVENITVDSTKSGTSAVPTVITAYPTETVWLRPTTTNAAGGVLWLYGSYFTVDGIGVDGAVIPAARTNLVGVGLNDGVTQSHHITFQNLEVKNLTNTNTANGSACMTSYGAQHHDVTYRNVVVHDCEISGTTPQNPGEHCLYIPGTNYLVEHSQFYNCHTDGIQVYPAPSGTTLRYNIVYNTGAHGILLQGDTSIRVYHNIVYSTGTDTVNYGSSQSGVYVNVSGAKVYQNTLYGNTGYGVWVASGSGTRVQNNILRGNIAGDFLDSGTSTVMSTNGCQATSGTKCTAKDPVFINAAGANFNLGVGSEAVGFGADLSSVCAIGMTCVYPTDVGALQLPTVDANSGVVPNVSPYKTLNISFTNSFAPMQKVNCPAVSSPGANAVISCAVTPGTNTLVVTLTNAVAAAAAVTYSFTAGDMLGSQGIGNQAGQLGNAALRAVVSQTAINQIVSVTPPGLTTSHHVTFSGTASVTESTATMQDEQWAGNYASFNALVTAAGSTSEQVIVDRSMTVTASLIVPANVTLQKRGNGLINCGTFTIHILGDIQAKGAFFNCPAGQLLFSGDRLIDADGDQTFRRTPVTNGVSVYGTTGSGALPTLAAGAALLKYDVALASVRLCTNSLANPAVVRATTTANCTDESGKYLLGYPTLVDADGGDGSNEQSTTHGPIGPLGSLTAYVLATETTKLCVFSAANPANLRTTLDSTCNTAGDGIRLLGSVGGAATSPMNTTFGYSDTNTSGAYDVGEPIYRLAGDTIDVSATQTGVTVWVFSDTNASGGYDIGEPLFVSRLAAAGVPQLTYAAGNAVLKEIPLPWFGANGNDTTDDTSAMSAWTASVNGTGGHLTTPSGVFIYSTAVTLFAGTHVDCSVGTIFKRTGTTKDCFTLANASVGDDIWITGCGFDENGAQAPILIDADGDTTSSPGLPVPITSRVANVTTTAKLCFDTATTTVNPTKLWWDSAGTCTTYDAGVDKILLGADTTGATGGGHGPFNSTSSLTWTYFNTDGSTAASLPTYTVGEPIYRAGDDFAQAIAFNPTNAPIHNIQIRNNHFFDSQYPGDNITAQRQWMFIGYCWDCWITNNWLEHGGRIKIGRPGRRIHANNNIIESVNDNAFTFADSGAGDFVTSDVEARGNLMHDCLGSCIYFGPDGQAQKERLTLDKITIADNIIWGNGTAGITVRSGHYGGDIQIHHNTIKLDFGGTALTPAYGIAVQQVDNNVASAPRIRIDDNFISLTGAAFSTAGLYIQGPSTGGFTELQINNNMVATGDVRLSGAVFVGLRFYRNRMLDGRFVLLTNPTLTNVDISDNIIDTNLGSGFGTLHLDTTGTISGSIARNILRQAGAGNAIRFSGTAGTFSVDIVDNTLSAGGATINFATTAQTAGYLRVRNKGDVAPHASVLRELTATASLNFTLLAASTCEVLTVAVTGAADGDVVSLGVPTALADVDGAVESTLFFGWVSAADVVSVRRCNPTLLATADPAAATVRVVVRHY